MDDGMGPHSLMIAAHVVLGTLAFGFLILFDFLLVAIARSRDVRVIRTTFGAAFRYARWVGILLGLAVILGFVLAGFEHFAFGLGMARRGVRGGGFGRRRRDRFDDAPACTGARRSHPFAGRATLGRTGASNSCGASGRRISHDCLDGGHRVRDDRKAVLTPVDQGRPLQSAGSAQVESERKPDAARDHDHADGGDRRAGKSQQHEADPDYDEHPANDDHTAAF